MIRKEITFKKNKYVLYDYEDGGKPEIYLVMNNTHYEEGDGIPPMLVDDWLFIKENYNKLFE